MKKKLLCALLTLTMCTGLLPMTAVAAECDHHTVHTADCGYVETVEGTDCTHEHDAECYELVLDCQHEHGDCGYIAAVEGIACDHECGEECLEICIHEHGDCSYVEAVEGADCPHICDEGCMAEQLNCTHKHDADCGYNEGTEGNPCLFQCEECKTEDEPVEEEPVEEIIEEAKCYCAEACTEDNANEYCEVCAVDYTACIGTDTAAAYADAVAKVGDVEYTDFATAVANWTDNTTLTMLDDVTDLEEQIELSGNGLVLDLNGKKLEATVDNAIKITAGEMTIRDSAGAGSFTTTQYGVLWLYGGNVNFESGTLESVTISKGTFNMTGGTIQAEAFTGIYVNDDEGTANISGGKINVTDYSMGIYNGFGTLNVSGNVVITSTYGYAIQNYSASVLTTISGDVALNGSTGELYLGKAIVLNTQPTGDTTWRVSINGDNPVIENGVFAIPGDGVTLAPAKFTSLIDGYEVKLNNKNELVLCNHSTATVAVSNGNGTHNTTCDCNGTIFESNIVCSGGMATATHLAVCAYCGGTYGELDANVNYDIIATAMTAAELKDAVAAWLAGGNTDISILLAAYADEEMFTAVKTALAESSVADGTINLTLAGVKTIPDEALSDYPVSIGGNKLKTLTLTDAETTGEFEPFARCTYLESVSLPNATTIGQWAFNECSNLISVYCPKVTVIGGYAFRKCAKLTTFDFTNITTIGDGAFRGCGFNTIVLPEATSIGGSAFVDNPNLVSFSAPKATSFRWYPWGAENIESSKLETLELTAAGDFTIGNQFFDYTPTKQINLVLNIDKKNQVTQNDDGTAAWRYTYTYSYDSSTSTDTATKTFKSIMLTCDDGTTNHTYKYTDMSNGTHKAECTVEGCGFYKYEVHTPDADSYIVNNDGTHSFTCTVCKTAVKEAHTLTYIANDNTITASCSVNCAYSESATITAENATYNGTAQEVATVTYSNGWTGGTLTVSYEDNTDVGTATASITIEGKTASVDFTISPALIKNATVTMDGNDDFSYTGKAVTPDVIVTGVDKTFTKDTDYTVTYSNNINAGEATVTVTFKGNYSGSLEKTFTITEKKVNNPAIELSQNSFVYDGTAKTPNVTVKDGGTVISEGEYEVSYSNNINAGTATVTITDKEGGNYAVSGTTTFAITQSATTFESGVQADKAVYTYGDTITVKAKPMATGTAPASTLRFRSGLATNQMALFYGDTQISEAVDAVNGVYTMTYDTANKAIAPGTQILTAKYVGNNNMADYSADVTVTLNKKELTVTGVTATSRAYDATATVDITEVALDGKVGSDDVNVSVTGLKGTLSEADAGTYTAVTLPELTLIDYNNCYILKQPESAVTTNVTISQAEAQALSSTMSVTNKLAKTYTFDLSNITPATGTWGSTPAFVVGEVALGSYYTSGATVEGTTLTLPINAVASDTTGEIGTVTVKITSQNYAESTLTITLNSTNKTAVTLTASMAEKTYDGNAIANPAVTAKDGETTVSVSGYNYVWKKADGTVLTEAPAAVGNYKVNVSVLDTDANYAGETTVNFSTGKGDPDMGILYAPITSSGKTLKDAELTWSGSTPGTLAWIQPDTTSVTANTEYEWKFTPEDTVNYKEMTGSITLWIKTASSGGGGSSSTSVKADDDKVTVDTSSSSISEKDANKAIDKAVDNDADEIVIDTNKDKVTLPEGMTENIADETDADLVVETKNGTVTIPNSTLEDLDAEGKVTVEVTKDSVNISDENGELSDIGKIKVTVSYEENSETGNVAVEVTKADGTKEVIEDVYDGKNSVTFEVDGSVTFVIIDDYVPGAEIPVAPVTPAENPFRDVSETDWFYKAVMYVSDNGLMSGVDADHFGPSVNTTRGMITTILWRMEGKPVAGEVPFKDVKADMYYADAIAWAAENGIVSGYGDTFGPDDNITREQLASILYRYTKYKGEGFEGVWAFRLDFSDVNELSEYAYEPMCWCVMNGIISGNDDGTLDPAGHAQRAHAAQMLMKFLENE